VVAHRSSESTERVEKGADVALHVLQTWRGVVADRFSRCENGEGKIPPQPLSMLHHVEASIRIEYPELGTGIPSTQFESFLQVLYDTGRMRGEAQSQWKGQVKHSITPSLTPSSTFQTRVYAAASELAEGWKHEYWDPELEYPIDVALPAQKVALEADGPTHFTINRLPSKRLLGASLLKRRLLSKLGWTVVSVPYYEWPGKLGVQEQVEYLSQLLKRHGVILSISQQVPNDVPPLESKDQALCELSKTGGSNGDCKEELEKPNNANLLLQRASRLDRLDIVNFQRGKISRMELAKRHISRRIVTDDDYNAC
jgi:hypothetical protein